MDFELVKALCSRVSNYLNDRVIGHVSVHYDFREDMLQVQISHKNLKFEKFRYNYFNFSHDILNAIPAIEIARFILKEYKEYLNKVFFKEG